MMPRMMPMIEPMKPGTGRLAMDRRAVLDNAMAQAESGMMPTQVMPTHNPMMDSPMMENPMSDNPMREKMMTEKMMNEKRARAAKIAEMLAARGPMVDNGPMIDAQQSGYFNR